LVVGRLRARARYGVELPARALQVKGSHTLKTLNKKRLKKSHVTRFNGFSA
jgi:hypothetical protein